MNEKFIAQIIAELTSANEQAFAVLANAVGDVIGRAELQAALAQRLKAAQSAESHPMRDKLLATAALALKSER